MKIILFLVFLAFPVGHLVSQDLQRLSKEMVFGDDPNYSIRSYNYFMSVIRDKKLEKTHIQKFNGMAISPFDAANCMLETKRTQVFVRSLYAAAESLGKKEVKILYVGCGPFAPFMTLTAPLLPNASYSLIEISENSAETATVLINRLGLQHQLDTLMVADATNMEIPEGETYDIIITETMDAGLNNEMMIPILINVLPQLKKDVILIPEEVELELVLSNSSGHSEKWERHEIFTVTELLQCYWAEKKFPVINLTLLETGLDQGYISTTVKVFKDNYLLPGESSISTELPVTLELGIPLKFSYGITPPRLLIDKPDGGSMED